MEIIYQIGYFDMQFFVLLATASSKEKCQEILDALNKSETNYHAEEWKSIFSSKIDVNKQKYLTKYYNLLLKISDYLSDLYDKQQWVEIDEDLNISQKRFELYSKWNTIFHNLRNHYDKLCHECNFWVFDEYVKRHSKKFVVKSFLLDYFDLEEYEKTRNNDLI